MYQPHIAKDTRDGAVLNPAHTRAMEAAMARHEEELRRKAHLRELQEADHQSKIDTDRAEIQREQDLILSNKKRVLADLAEQAEGNKVRRDEEFLASKARYNTNGGPGYAPDVQVLKDTYEARRHRENKHALTI